jgi:hypothetical protein
VNTNNGFNGINLVVTKEKPLNNNKNCFTKFKLFRHFTNITEEVERRIVLITLFGKWSFII